MPDSREVPQRILNLAAQLAQAKPTHHILGVRPILVPTEKSKLDVAILFRIFARSAACGFGRREAHASYGCAQRSKTFPNFA
jgi:hypothetical protein